MFLIIGDWKPGTKDSNGVPLVGTVVVRAELTTRGAAERMLPAARRSALTVNHRVVAAKDHRP